MPKTTTVISSENLILFDWLTFTSHCDSPETIMQLLGLKDVPWQKMDKGRNGYRGRFFFENISSAKVSKHAFSFTRFPSGFSSIILDNHKFYKNKKSADYMRQTFL